MIVGLLGDVLGEELDRALGVAVRDGEHRRVARLRGRLRLTRARAGRRRFELGSVASTAAKWTELGRPRVSAMPSS